MYQSPVIAHGFNHQSLFRQPVSNLRQVNEIVWNGNNENQGMGGSVPPTYGTIANQQFVPGYYSSSKDQSELQALSSYPTVNYQQNGLSEHLPQTMLTGYPSTRSSRPVNTMSGAIQDRLLIRQSSLGTIPEGKYVSSQEQVPLSNSHSAGTIQDYIQKERKAHTMAPSARILGPSSNITTKMFASTVAPSDAQAIKQPHTTQTAFNAPLYSYPQSNTDMIDVVNNNQRVVVVDGGEEDNENQEEEDDDDAPIIVKVQYDPDAGGPPSEDVIRQAVDNQLRGQSRPKNVKEPIVLNFLNNPTQPEISTMPTKPLQPVLNRSAPSIPQLLSRSEQQQPSVQQWQHQQQLFLQQQLKQQQQYQLQEKQRQQQFQLQEKQRQQKQEQQRRQQELLLQQQEPKQKLQGYLQQHYELDQQQKEEQIRRNRLLWEQQQEQKKKVQEYLQQQYKLDQQRKEEQIRRDRLLWEQQQIQKKLKAEEQEIGLLIKQQLEREEQQKQQQLQREQQQKQQQLYHEQQQKQQQLYREQQQQREQQLQRAQEQKQQQLQREQQQQKARQLLQQQRQKQQEVHQRNRQIYQSQQNESAKQNASLPPTAPRSLRTVPNIRTIPANKSPPMHPSNNYTYPTQIVSQTSMPLRSSQQYPITTIQNLTNRNTHSTSSNNSAPSGPNAYNSHSRQNVPNSFVPIQAQGSSGQPFASLNGTNMNNTSPEFLQRSRTAPSLTEMFRPSSALDIPELSQENLRSMLARIPDLRGRRFSIEYAEPTEPDGYPIPSELDDASTKYPEAVIVDQLPSNIIQHVRSSDNIELKTALNIHGKPEKPAQSTKKSQPTSSKLKQPPSKVYHHSARPKQRVKHSRHVLSTISSHNDSSTETEIEEIEIEVVPLSKYKNRY